MSIELKPGWRRVRFDQMAVNVNDRIDNPAEAGVEYYVGLEHLDSDSLRIRRWGAPTDVEATKLRFRTGDIIFGRRRVYQRKLAVAEFDGICSAHAMVLRGRPEVVAPEFLPFFMQSDLFMNRAMEISVGSLSPTINWTALARQEFDLPPIDEQRRIAEVLEAVVEGSETLISLSHAIENLEAAFLQSQFESYFGGKHNWERVSLKEVAVVQTGIAKGNEPTHENTVSVPYLTVSSVQDGHLDLDKIANIRVDSDRLDRYRLQEGDVLMTEGGDPDKLGRGTVWQGEIRNCIHQNHVFAVRPIRGLLDSWFLAAVARSAYGKGYFLACSKRTSNLATINKKQVGEFLIPLPPIEIQQEIVAQWHTIRTAQRSSDARRGSSVSLRKSLTAHLLEQ